jgi:hypothetical protein
MNSIGEDTANNDIIMKKTLKKLVDKEDDIIQQYKILKKIENSYEFDKTEFMRILEARKLFIEYKQQTKTEQIRSLYKLLEYLNTIDDKKQHFDTEIILNQINEFEEILNNYNLD